MPSSRVCLAVIVLATVLCGFAQAQAASNTKPTNKDEDQVAQLERDWLAADAKGDTAGLGKIVADDFIGSSFDGQVLSKQDIIPQGGAPGGFAGATPSETSVRIFGDTAVLMGFINTAGAQPKQIRVTLVCQKRSQGWQMIAAHLARM
jgi:ketosteroid isomerase-like protein